MIYSLDFHAPHISILLLRLRSKKPVAWSATTREVAGIAGHPVTMALNKNRICRGFSICLRKAEEILDIVTRHTSTGPTFKEMVELMELRTGLEVQFSRMKESLNIFLQCDMVYVNTRDLYDELADIGKTTEEAVGKALSKSGEFLGCLTDVGGLFSTSKTACFGTTRDILGFLNKDMSVGINSVEILELKGLRRVLVVQFASMKESWNSLIQYAIDNDDTTVFHEISEIVWTTEEAVDKALFDSDNDDAEDDVHEIDVSRSDFDEGTDDDAEEDVLEGDVCRGDIGGDFDKDMKNQRFVIDAFKE